MSTRIRFHVAVLLSLGLIAGTAGTAMAHDTAAGTSAKAAPNGPPKAKISLRLKGLRSGKLTVGKRIEARGTLRPFVAGQKVTVRLRRGHKTIKRRSVTVHRKSAKSSLGQFDFSQKLIKPGHYKVEAAHVKNASLGKAEDTSRGFSIRYPDLGGGDTGGAVKIFNKLLAKQGYVNDENPIYDSATGRAVLAYHKVNGEERTESATKSMFKKLAKGKGGYNLHHPGAGKHVEVDLSRQVMVLAKHGKVDEIYTVSTGKASTPTILGKYSFYRKEPGFNSHAMYYSVYFQGGYATHGYSSVPDYPASHGCVRNPIPNSKHIYDWIDLGDTIYIYR